uniref:Uncharacterized protein n=1 Tax=Octopus bimaculoides TaxID=37653 RepID=A0A0L8GNN2_OCTBM
MNLGNSIKSIGLLLRINVHIKSEAVLYLNHSSFLNCPVIACKWSHIFLANKNGGKCGHMLPKPICE